MDVKTSSIVTGAIDPSPHDSLRGAQELDSGFSDMLASAFEKASLAENKASQAAQRFAEGDTNLGIHEVVILAEKANISLRYAVALKNKVLDAYRELMNTQV